MAVDGGSRVVGLKKVESEESSVSNAGLPSNYFASSPRAPPIGIREVTSEISDMFSMRVPGFLTKNKFSVSIMLLVRLLSAVLDAENPSHREMGIVEARLRGLSPEPAAADTYQGGMTEIQVYITARKMFDR